MDKDIFTETLQLQQTLGQPPNPQGEFIRISIPKESFKYMHGFRPYFAYSTAEEKLAFLKNSSALKLHKRTQKALEKESKKKSNIQQ